MDLSQYSKFMISLAEQSAKIIKSYFFNPKLQIDIKSDRSPVTQADKEAEEVMRKLIQKKYPTHGIIGEEYGSEKESAEFIWTIDPIDGTKSFISGVPLFGTMISLCHQGRPILGLIHQPILNMLCIGNNTSTKVNGKQVKLRTVNHLPQASLLTSDIKNIETYQNKKNFDLLVKKTDLFRTWGDAYGYLMVAAGLADILIDAVISKWEICAIVPIITGAGGVVTSWNGGNALKDGSCVVANTNIHWEVIKILNGD